MAGFTYAVRANRTTSVTLQIRTQISLSLREGYEGWQTRIFFFRQALQAMEMLTRRLLTSGDSQLSSSESFVAAGASERNGTGFEAISGNGKGCAQLWQKMCLYAITKSCKPIEEYPALVIARVMRGRCTPHGWFVMWIQNWNQWESTEQLRHSAYT